MTNLKKIYFVFSALSFLSCSPLIAITSNWIGSSFDDTEWSNPSNWDNGVPNGEDDIANFPLKTTNTATYGVMPLSTSIATLDSDVTLKAISIANNQSVSIINPESVSYNLILSSVPTTYALNANTGNYSVDQLMIADNSNLTFSGQSSQIFNVLNITGGSNSTVSLSFRGKKRGNQFQSVFYSENFAGNLNIGSYVYYFIGSNLLSIKGNIQNEGLFESSIGEGGVGLLGEFVNTSRGQISLATSSVNFHNSFTNTSRAKMAITAGQVTFNGPVLNTSTATLTNELIPECTFNNDFQNTSKASFVSNNGATNTFTSSFTNSGRARLSATYSLITHHGSYLNQSTAIYNSCSSVFNGDFTNTKTMTYKMLPNFFLGLRSFNNSVTNSGSARMTFEGVGTGVQACVFGGIGLLTNSDSASISYSGICFSNFHKPILNSGKATISFAGSSSNMFHGGFSLDHSGSRSIDFTSNGIIPAVSDTDVGGFDNKFLYGATLTNSGSGNIRFNKYSVNLFDLGSSLTNSGTGSIQFYDRSYNVLYNLTNGANATVSLFGNSASYIKGSVVNNGLISASGNSLVALIHPASLSGTGTIQSSGGYFYIYSRGNTFSGDVQIFRNSYFLLSADLSNANFVVGNANKRNRGGALWAVQDAYSSATPSANNVTLVNNGRGSLNIPYFTTFDVLGDYNQNNNTLLLLIRNDESGLLNVTGDCNIGGTLYLYLTDYTPDTPYTIVTYQTGNLNGTFRTLTASNGALITPNYTAAGNTAITVSIAAAESLKKRLKSKAMTVPGDAKNLLLYLSQSAPKLQRSTTSRKALEAIQARSKNGLIKAVKELQPMKTSHLVKRGTKGLSASLADLSKSFKAQRANRQFKGLPSNREHSLKKNALFLDQPYFVNQISLSSRDMNLVQEPIYAQTNGANFGFKRFIDDSLFLQAGFICLESNEKSSVKANQISWKNLAIAPSIGWISDHVFINLNLLYGLTGYQQERSINIADFKKIAHSKFKSLDSLFELTSGYEGEIGSGFQYEVISKMGSLTHYFQPYQEFGGGLFNLYVFKNIQSRLLAESKFIIKYQKGFEKCFLKCEFYVQGELSAPIHTSPVRSKLSILKDQNSFFVNQKRQIERSFFLGARAEVLKKDLLDLSLDLENDFLSSQKKLSLNILFSY